MYEIAKPPPHASFPAIQPTTRFSKIRHGTEFAVDGPRGVPARVESVAGFLRRVFVFETCVDVADEMIVIIITNHHLLWFAVFTHFAPEIFVESVKVVLELGRVHLCFGIVGGVLVEVGEEDGLAVGGLDVFAGTAVAVAAGADFVVETAIYFVLFCAEDGGEVVGHNVVRVEKLGYVVELRC